MPFDLNRVSEYLDAPYPPQRCDGMSTLFQCQQFSLTDCVETHHKRWTRCLRSLQLRADHCLKDLVPCGLSWEQLIICIWMAKIPLFGRGLSKDLAQQLQELEIVVHLPELADDWADMLEEMIHNQSVLLAPICPELYQIYLKVFRSILTSMKQNQDEIRSWLREKTTVLQEIRLHPTDVDMKSLWTFGPLEMKHFAIESQEAASLIRDFEQGTMSWLISYLIQVQITTRYHLTVSKMDTKRRLGQDQCVLKDVQFVRIVDTDVDNKYYDYLQYPKSLYDQAGSYTYYFHEVEVVIGRQTHNCILDTMVLSFFFPNSFDLNQ